MKLVAVSVMISLVFGCKSEAPRYDKLELYNSALDQIMTERYFQYCLDPVTVENVRKAFNEGKFDSLKYLKIGDSLKSLRRRASPRCVLDYSNEFQIFTSSRVLDEDIKKSIAKSLKDPFVAEFKNGSVEAITDTLSQTAQLNIGDLAIDYLEIVQYAGRANRPYGDGMGVFSLSKIFLDTSGNKAILFYEFNCGPRCGSGQIVFLERGRDKWKIVKYKRIWDS